MQLEEYPALDLCQLGLQREPVFALRILEFLTPIKRLSSDNEVLDPVPGQLLMHRYRSVYAPWRYSPRNLNIRKVIADWISAQSKFPKPLRIRIKVTILSLLSLAKPQAHRLGQKNSRARSVVLLDASTEDKRLILHRAENHVGAIVFDWPFGSGVTIEPGHAGFRSGVSQ